MELIVHRRNSLSELLASPTQYGVEVDIRSFGDKLVIHHDPLIEGESFEEWIAAYRHGTLILNVKEEGLEAHLIGLMKSKGIENFFFPRSIFPFSHQVVKSRRAAVRGARV